MAFHADARVGLTGKPVRVRGATAVATRATAAVARAWTAAPALLNGTVGLVAVSDGRLWLALAMGYDGDTITSIDIIAEPEDLAALKIGVVL